MRQSGFTTIEMIIVVIIVGIVATMGFPRIRDAIEKTNVRSAKVAIRTYVATTRATAVARGCRSTVHFVSGGDPRMWVTTCKVSGAGTAPDTVAGVEYLGERWGIRLQSGKDSIQYDPRGMRLSYEVTAVVIRDKGDNPKDSIVINQLGKVVR